MAYESAKTELAQASTMAQRASAVQSAMLLGMRLDAIEAYLDWLDAVRPLADYSMPEECAKPNGCPDGNAAAGGCA